MTAQDAAHEVITCMQSMGENKTNPVLEVLEAGKPFLENQKYPEKKLRFNNGQWRAYYHSHGDPYRFENEHGHFHIFYKLNDIQWTHVAGLSMDNQGQAQRWFTTNRWVTDEHWQPAADILPYLEIKQQPDGLLLVEQWLIAMLHLYQDDLGLLLQERDEKLNKLVQDKTLGDLLENRDYYILSESNIDLLDKLTGIMSNSAMPDPDQIVS